MYSATRRRDQRLHPVYAHTDGAGPRGSYDTAAHHVPFPAHDVARMKVSDVGADFHDLTDELVSNDERGLDAERAQSSTRRYEDPCRRFRSCGPMSTSLMPARAAVHPPTKAPAQHDS